MPYCARCGAPVGNADSFCVACGAPTRRVQPAGDASRSDELASPTSATGEGGPDPQPAIRASGTRLRSLLVRSRLIIGLLVVAAAFSIGSALSTAMHLGDLLPLDSSAIADEALLDGYAARQDSIDAFDAFGSLAAIAGGVFWLVWQHRAHANLRMFGAGGLRFSPGWGVGWWFVPIANLWQPFRAVRELWTVSRPHPDGTRRSSAPLIGWWWAAWLISTGLVAVGSGLIYDTRAVSDIVTGATLLIAGEMLTVMAATLATVIVLDVLEGQQGLHETFTSVLLNPPGVG